MCWRVLAVQPAGEKKALVRKPRGRENTFRYLWEHLPVRDPRSSNRAALGHERARIRRGRCWGTGCAPQDSPSGPASVAAGGVKLQRSEARVGGPLLPGPPECCGRVFEALVTFERPGSGPAGPLSPPTRGPGPRRISSVSFAAAGGSPSCLWKQPPREAHVG